MKRISAKKLDMTQRFAEGGKVTPVTKVIFEEFPTDLPVGTGVKVVGKSKGKGFAGVMKRHGFSGLPTTHGASTKVRAPGSIGATTTPGRVYKGKRMAGRMGGERVTIKGLEVIELDAENKTLLLSGPVPGPRLADLTIEYEPSEPVEAGAVEEDQTQETAAQAEEVAEEVNENAPEIADTEEPKAPAEGEESKEDEGEKQDES